MSQENIGAKAFIANQDLEAYRRVRLSVGRGDSVEYADAASDFIGVTASKVSQGESVSVNLKTRGRTFKMVANAAIAEGSEFYGAADGKISAAVTGDIIGRALESASSDMEVIEGILA